MRRSAWIFVAAILLPSLVLAWLAVRSARDQQVILEHQQAIISQDITDALAKGIQQRLDDSRSTFTDAVQRLLRKSASPSVLAARFHRELPKEWDLAEVGFAVDLNGTIYSPERDQGALAKAFRNENDPFLSNRENVPVFSQSAVPVVPQPTAAIPQPQSQAALQANQSQQGISQQGASQQYNQSAALVPRQVVPSRNFAPQLNTLSNSIPADSDFRKLVGAQTSGAVARFSGDKLRLMVWYRPSANGPLIFGAQISQRNLARSFYPLLQSPDLHRSTDAEYCLAILDDRGKPVALSREGFTADWKHPLVATEIGEALPHWEAAFYPADPKQVSRLASTLQLTVGSVVLALVGTILLGGWFISADVRRKMRLAQQKTDFVSNVSHELKTPLTSIRMFADMLAEGRVVERDRQSNYLRIISAESARLTRLINNVLDFARMELGGASGERRDCDLAEVVREVVNTCRPHLETVGIAIAMEPHAETLPMIGDRDALAQIVLNLLSNAEKYGGGEIHVVVRRQKSDPPSPGHGCVDVMDRGPGIPAAQRDAIFQPFHRLDDSLASGVSGSGLGLTLARRMAQAHGGNVVHVPREGGGSCFTLTVPLR